MKVNKFEIEHIDPLGQGVSKKDDKIIFIPKTLPGESGTCEILKSKKKVHFARAIKIDRKSDLRIEDQCPHFQECPSCHYLHTDYEQEITFKEEALKRHFRTIQSQLESSEIHIHKASERFGYRNRVQLHYDVEDNKLGYFDALQETIIEVPKCKLLRSELQEEFDQLYQNWQKKISLKDKVQGHFEIYLKDNKVSVHQNKNYAHGGFSQVNEQMNQLMNLTLSSHLKKRSGSAIDLFGGSGNLTATSTHLKTLVVDGTEKKYIKVKDHQSYRQLNLYGRKAPDQFSQLISQHFDEKCETLIIDPPRSGLKNIDAFLEKASYPEMIYYIGCECPNLVRDLAKITDQYELLEVHLFDLFPGTRHFETLAILKRR